MIKEKSPAMLLKFTFGAAGELVEFNGYLVTNDVCDAVL